MTVFDEISAYEDSTPQEPIDSAARHDLLFRTAEDTELMNIHSTGAVPIPAVGDVIGLHDGTVRVAAVETIYGRDEQSGAPAVFTRVTVEEISGG